MKKIRLFVILAILLIIVGFGGLYRFVFKDVYAPEKTEVQNGLITQIPIESVKGISAKAAEEVCYSVMGKADKETGFTFSFGVADAIQRGDKQYYVIRASWLVNNSHMSYIGDFFVSADGKEVYSGVALNDEYQMDEKIWSEKRDI